MTERSVMRWGIIGPGKIAGEFAQALQVVEDAHLHAVAGRNKAKAAKFAHDHGARLSYDSHYALLDNPDIDAVYIATPHRYHYQMARDCLLAGKPLLCEKPLTVNSREALSLIELSQKQGVFLMEALWTRFLPVYEDISQWLLSGKIGEVQRITSSFGFVFPRDPQDRLLSHELAGGALLDLGVYNLAMSQWVFGIQPTAHTIKGYIGDTGVDEHNEITLDYSRGRQSTFTVSLQAQSENDFTIHGERGCIRVHPMFWNATQATLFVRDRSITSPRSTTIHRPLRATGLEYEIEAAARCIRTGLAECPAMPHRDTLATMQLMDSLRSDMGLTYAFE
jgi:predicted dehydrogenase